jgi:hypothetical protein
LKHQVFIQFPQEHNGLKSTPLVREVVVAADDGEQYQPQDMRVVARNLEHMSSTP